MKKLILLILSIACIGVLADVKQLSKVKLKDKVVTKVNASGNGISVDENSNLYTEYRGMTYTNFTVDINSSNRWYRVEDVDGTNSLIITCNPRESAWIICNDYFSKIYVLAPTTSINGVRQSFFELDYLIEPDETFSIEYGNGILRSFNADSISGNINGACTNLVVLEDMSESLMIAVSAKLTEN